MALPSAVTANDIVSADTAVVRKTVTADQFCSFRGNFAYVADPAHKQEQKFLAGWASERRFILEQRGASGAVTIVLPPDVRDTRSAVQELTTFFGLFSRQCLPESTPLPIVTTGVQGLDIVTNADGVQDFNFTP